MAQLTYNSLKKFCYYEQELKYEDSNEETLRDIVLRQVISNHLKTKLNIDDCKKNKNRFISSSKLEDLSQFSKGLLTFESYKNICQQFSVKEILSSCGLEDREIKILLEENSGSGKEATEAYFERLKVIYEKIQHRQRCLEGESSDVFPQALRLNRHEFEEECKKVPSLQAEKLTRSLIQLEPYSDPNVPSDHPINTLVDLEKQLFPKSQDEDTVLESVIKKRKCDTISEEEVDVIYLNQKPESFWDMKKKPIILKNSTETLKSQMLKLDPGCCSVYKNKTSNILDEKIDYSKAFVWPLNPEQLIPISTIQKNRISSENIRKWPKLNHYDPGIPSQTLYLKNLPHNLSPLFLASLFGHFEEENSPKNIEYRILKGRMRGQAFIKFRTDIIAAKALALCNGYLIEGKPMVIEYGKHSFS